MDLDVTGVWSADDGGYYYVFHLGEVVWWVGMSGDAGLVKGLTFCNVFSGTFAALSRHGREPPRDLFHGSWADVPRGTARALGFGSLTIHLVLDDEGVVVQLERRAATGNFGATSWKRHQGAPPLQTNVDMTALMSVALKSTTAYDKAADVALFLAGFLSPPAYRETLGDRLEVVKDCVALWGTLTAGEKNPAPFDTSFSDGVAPTLDNFWGENVYGGPSQHDADITCRIDGVDVGALEGIGFFQSIADDDLRQEVQTKLIDDFHGELVMFARDGTESDSRTLLPGWGEQGSDSVLVNGVPLAGQVVAGSNVVHRLGDYGPAATDPVRVTGPLVIDYGHTERYLEIHPVFSIDHITATTTDDLTGVWGDLQGETYYLHQVGHRIYGFVFSPFGRAGVADVFVGMRAEMVQGDEAIVTVEGNWARLSAIEENELPSNLGTLTLEVDADRLGFTLSGATPLAGRVVRKLYNVDGHLCPPVAQLTVRPTKTGCVFDEVEGGALEYIAGPPSIAAIADVHYEWTVSAGSGTVVAGSGGARFAVSDLPVAGTSVKVAVDATTAGGCAYHGERTFVTVTADFAALQRRLCQSVREIGLITRRPPEPVSPGDPASAPWQRAVLKLHQLSSEVALLSAALLEKKPEQR